MIMSKSLSGSSARFAAAVILIIGLRLWAERTLVDIIVGQGVKAELQSKLDRLAADLENDGYTARITSWPAGRGAEDVWNHLKDGYDNDNLQGAILVGHIPVPRSPQRFETDILYWCMTSYRATKPKHIWVSRMYAPSREEVSLLSNALDANHAYRTGQTRLSHKAWTSVGSDWDGLTRAEDWAQRALSVWPSSEAVVKPAEAVFGPGGDLLQELQHGSPRKYSDVTRTRLERDGCQIRVALNMTCNGGDIGGVVNYQILGNGTKNVISIGGSIGMYPYSYDILNRGDPQFRNAIGAGTPWGTALLDLWPFRPISKWDPDDYTLLYGDLSLPSMMYPPEAGVPAKAGVPRPDFDEYVVDLHAPLLWISRVGTESHDVYFGTDSLLGAGDFRGNRTETTYDPGTLWPATTYYWRIDEKNAHGTTTGGLWRFTTDDRLEKRLLDSLNTRSSVTRNRVAGTKFTIAKPIHITEIFVDNLLIGATNNVGIWQEADSADPLHVFSVETGATKAEVSHPVDIVLPEGTYRIAGLFKEYHFNTWIKHQDIPAGVRDLKGVYRDSATTLAYPSMESRTRVYGQVDLRFSFVGAADSPPGRATNPVPENGATGEAIGAELSWSAGGGATSHVVYFGTDSTPDATERQGAQTAGVFDPGPLQANTTYYWRVDERNGHGTTEGEVWSFTTRDGAVGVTSTTRAVVYARGALHLATGSSAGGSAVVEILDLRGRSLWKRHADRMPAGGLIPLPAHAHGAYIVTVHTEANRIRGVITVVQSTPYHQHSGR